MQRICFKVCLIIFTPVHGRSMLCNTVCTFNRVSDLGLISFKNRVINTSFYQQLSLFIVQRGTTYGLIILAWQKYFSDGRLRLLAPTASLPELTDDLIIYRSIAKYIYIYFAIIEIPPLDLSRLEFHCLVYFAMFRCSGFTFTS